jgi:hypothetical protein
VEQPTYKDKVMNSMPGLTILDGKRLDGERGGKGKYRWKEGYKGPKVLREPGAAALVSLVRLRVPDFRLLGVRLGRGLSLESCLV